MRLVVQRSKKASVSVSGKIVGKIPYGLTIFVGFTQGDSQKEIDFLADKVLHLRIFDDENGVMNRSLLDVKGDVLSVSQFTLYADTKKGRRPSYLHALKGEEAVLLYEQWNQTLRGKGITVETGVFGADMLVSIENDGPVTITMKSGE